jgi:PAS domain S-box-containing protein
MLVTGLRCGKELMISDNHHRVLVVAPTGRDSHLLCEMLSNNGITCESYADVRQLCKELQAGVGAILLTEEALGLGALAHVSNALGEQPKWSDVPVILLTSNAQRVATIGRQIFRENGARGNLIIVEKPVRPLSLRSTVDAALTTRTRQYELRDYLEEKKRTEELLRQANERIEMILDSITDRFFALDKEWRITRVNKHAEEQLRTLGKDPVDFIGTVLWEEFPNAPTEDIFRRVMSERAAITHEHYYAPLGEWVESSIYPTHDGGLAIFQRYITERKRAETALRESEERYRLLVEGVKEYAIFVLDTEGHVTTWNQGAERITGYRAEEIIGEHFSRFYSAEDVERGKPELHLKRAAEKAHFEDESWRIRKDGTRFFAEVLITALTDEAGHLRGFSKVTHDITERKRAEEGLRRSEAYLAQGQRLSHTGSWAWNVSTEDLFWSEEHFRICGVDPESFNLTVETAQQLIHPEDRPSANQAFYSAIIERHDFEWDLRILRPDGTTRYVHSVAQPVFNEAGELTEYVGTIMDNTERKRAEEALQKAQAELACVNRVATLGALTASIAHEINQPLAALVSDAAACVRWLQREVPDLGEARKSLERIVENGYRAGDVIKGIRSLVGKTPGEKELLNMNETIREVIALTGRELTQNSVVLWTELQPNIVAVLGDRIQLQQVLLNLILNSIEAMNDVDWPVRELVIRSQASKPGEVMVTLRDSGAGLGSHDPERIFDSFFSTKPKGLGLGLSISRTIIEAHGGRLWATQNKDIGATFRFILPAIEGSRPASS